MGLEASADQNDSEDEAEVLDSATVDEVSGWQRCPRPNAFWQGDSPSDYVGSSYNDSLTGIKMFMGDIRLLRPLQGQVHLLDCLPEDHCQAQWALCEWTPQGTPPSRSVDEQQSKQKALSSWILPPIKSCKKNSLRGTLHGQSIPQHLCKGPALQPSPRAQANPSASAFSWARAGESCQAAVSISTSGKRGEFTSLQTVGS